MIRKKILVVSLVVFVLAFVLLNFVTIYFFNLPFSPVAITGKVGETAYVRLYIQGGDKVITIYTPENTTYDNNSYTCSGLGYPKCDDYRYNLSLNVSADFPLEVGDSWKYSLYDLKHGVYINQNTVFTPYTSVPFVRWGNLLTVFANEEDGDWVNESVVFTIDVPNSAPLIQNFSEKIFVCESETLESLDASNFNVFDIDEESFATWWTNYRISGGRNVFGLVPRPKTSNYISPFQIISGERYPLDKNDVGDYDVEISVIDSSGLSDTNSTNITVIEINNIPTTHSGLGLETIYMSGANSVFSYQFLVDDEEDGVSDDGNLFFNFSGALSLVLNSSTGVASYVPVEENRNKKYLMRIYATDNALASVHENFSICSGRGYRSDNITIHDEFILSITDNNRAPSIDSYSPAVTSFNSTSTTVNSFSVTVSDADLVDLYPSINWYVDGVLMEENENIPSDDFDYTFGCGISGSHNVTIITSDGLLNDSVTWDITVTNVACPVASVDSGGGGGGGGGSTLGGICNEQWSCLEWGLCQNAERSFRAKSLSPEDFSSVKDLCAQNQYDDRFCGFQITKCFDLNMCNNTEMKIPRPSEFRVCYFTENPNCIDGITNCHDGGCELLVDCGGPCDPCPTCSDGKKNQGENGVDCGGPCPYACEAESPFGTISFVLIGLLFLLLLLVIYSLYKIFMIVRHRFFLVGGKRKGKDKQGFLSLCLCFLL